MRNVRRALAASFVVTYVGGCDSKPSQPAATPTVDVGAAPSAAAAPNAATAAPADSSGGLPPAPATGHVQRAPDGTCMWYPDRPPVRAGGRVMLNPPPPHPVQCPADDAGT